MNQIPNIITFSRLLFLVAIAWLVFEQRRGVASVVFVLSLVAALSDWLDGWVARRWALVTNFGKLFDALVDKIMVVGLFLVLVLSGVLARGIAWLEVTAWVIIAATALRDILITGMRMVAARKGAVLAADTMGKRKTIWQITSICVLFFVPVLRQDLGMPPAVIDFFWLNGLLYYLLGGVLTIYSGTLYVIRYWPYMLGSGTQGTQARE